MYIVGTSGTSPVEVSQGVVFANTDGTLASWVIGDVDPDRTDEVVLPENEELIIQSGMELTIPKNMILTIPAGTTVTMELGTILNNYGLIQLDGVIKVNVLVSTLNPPDGGLIMGSGHIEYLADPE